MKGSKKDKLTLKKGSKGAKEEVLKQVLAISVDLNETCDFKQPMKLKEQPFKRSKAINVKTIEKDADKKNKTKSVRNYSESQSLDSNNELLTDLNSGTSKKESKESERKETLVCPLCTGSFVQEELQKHIPNCMKQQYQYKKKEECNDRYSGDEILAKKLQKREEEKQKDVDLTEVECFFCQFCQKDLSRMNSQRKTQHINRCADKEEEEKRLQEEKKNALEAAKTAVLDCPMCGKHLRTETSRKTHLKKCATSLCVPVDQMLKLVRKQEEEHQGALEAGILPNNIRKQKAKPNIQGRKRKLKQTKSELDEDTQIAMAISTSMAEEKERQEKELCAQLKSSKTSGNPELDKKSKKKINEAQLPLLQMTWEEKQRRLEERVNMVLLPQEEDDDDMKCTPELKESGLKEKYKSCSTNPESAESPDPMNGLWAKSSLLENLHSHTHQYYVQSLMPPIRISTLKTGSKMKRVSEIPGRRRSCDAPAEKEIKTPSMKIEEAEEEEMPVSTQTAMVLAELAEDADNEIEMDIDISTLQSSGFCPERPLEIPQEDLPAVGESLKRSLIALVDNPLSSDVQIITGDGDRVYAHTLLLSIRSPKLLEFIEKGEIHIKDVCSDAVISLLKYIYSGAVCLTQSTIDPVISLAERFDLIELQNLGEKVRDLNADSKVNIPSPRKQQESSVIDIVKAVWSDSDSESEVEEEKNDKDISRDDYYDIMCTQREKIRRMNSHDGTAECKEDVSRHSDDVLFDEIPYYDDKTPSSSILTNSDKTLRKLEIENTKGKTNLFVEKCSFVEDSNSNNREVKTIRALSDEQHSKYRKDRIDEHFDVNLLSDSSSRESDETTNERLEDCMVTNVAPVERISVESTGLLDNSGEDTKISGLKLNESLSNSQDEDKQIIYNGSRTQSANSLRSNCSPQNHESPRKCPKSTNSDCSPQYMEKAGECSDDDIILIETVETSVYGKPHETLMTPANSKVAASEKQLELSSSDLFGSPVTSQESRRNPLSFKRQNLDSSSTPLPMPSSKRFKISTPVYRENSTNKKDKRLSGLTSEHDSMLISPVPDIGKRRNLTITTPGEVSPKLGDSKAHFSKSKPDSDSDEDLKITGDNFAELSQQNSMSPKFSVRPNQSDRNNSISKGEDKNNDVTMEHTLFKQSRSCGDTEDLMEIGCDDIDLKVDSSPEKKQNDSQRSRNEDSSHEKVQNDSQRSRNESDGGVWDDFDDCGVGFAVECDISEQSITESEISSSVKQHSVKEDDLSFGSQDNPSLPETCQNSHGDNNSFVWSEAHEPRELVPADSPHNSKEFKTPVNERRHQSRQKKAWVPPSPFTPMKDYDAMATPNLKKEVQKYGIRVLPKKKMLLLLKDLYQKTHAYETDSEFEEDVTVEDASKPCDISSSQESDVSDVMEETFWGGDGILETQQSPVKDLPEKLSNFIHGNPKLYERMLQYEPLEIDVLKKEIAESGIKCSMEKLQNYLDEKCITFTMKNMRKNRNTKKRGKKNMKKKD